MALWAKTTQLPPELFTIAESLYEKYFTTSVRSTIGIWLEKYMMYVLQKSIKKHLSTCFSKFMITIFIIRYRDDVDADNPINENYVDNIMKSFKKELQRQNELTDTNPQLIIELNVSSNLTIQ